MTVSSSRKKWFRLNSLLLCNSLLTACYSLGTEKLPDIPAPFQLKRCELETNTPEPLRLTWDTWSFELRFAGPAAALTTARTPWGWHQRYVIPYTRQTLLFELEVENKSLELLRLQPEQMRLHLPDGRSLSPLVLSDLKRAWPAEAVWSQETLLDRAAALGEVTRTLFSARPVLQGGRRTGILPFPRFELRAGEQIRLEMPDPTQSEKSLSVCFQAF